jgi:hypothetical protein
MAETVTIAGHKVSKWLAYGGAAAAGLLLIVWYRNKQASAASAAASSTDASSTDTGTAQGIDPATGYPYGSPEDQAALQAMGSGYGAGYGGDGYGDYGGGTSGPLPGPGGGGFTTNAEWAQAAEQYLGSTGSDAIGAALGKYLAGVPISQDQATIVEQAIAVEGNPPVSGPNGMPPSFKLQAGGGSGTNAVNPVAGLKVTDAGYTGIDLAWNASQNATDYLVTAEGPGAPPAFKTGGATTARVRNLKGKTTYNIRVRAQPGGTGGTDAHVTAKTQ